MGIKERWQRDLDREIDPQAIPSAPSATFYRVNVWTGPGAVREVAARVKSVSGLMRCGYVGEGAEKIWFDIQASDATDALLRAADLLRYVNLSSLASGKGFNARKVS